MIWFIISIMLGGFVGLLICFVDAKPTRQPNHVKTDDGIRKASPPPEGWQRGYNC